MARDQLKIQDTSIRSDSGHEMNHTLDARLFGKRRVSSVDFGDDVRLCDFRIEQDTLASRIGQGLISHRIRPERKGEARDGDTQGRAAERWEIWSEGDRKSTRLNSSH